MMEERFVLLSDEADQKKTIEKRQDFHDKDGLGPTTNPLKNVHNEEKTN